MPMNIRTNSQEIVSNVFRLNIAPNTYFEFNQFLIVDEKTCLVHAGKEKLFSELKEMVLKVLGTKQVAKVEFRNLLSNQTLAQVQLCFMKKGISFRTERLRTLLLQNCLSYQLILLLLCMDPLLRELPVKLFLIK